MKQMAEKENDFTRDVQYYKFCAYGFLKDLRFYEPFLMLFFLEKGISFLQIGTLYAAREICINVLEIPSGVVADSLGRRRVMAVSFLFYIVSFVVFFFSQTYWVLFAAMLLYAGGDAFRTGTHKAMIFEYLEMHNWGHLKAHYYGHTRSWSQRGAAVSSLLAGALVFWQGSYAPVFLFSIIPYLLDLGLVLSYPKELDGRRNTNERTMAQEFSRVIFSLFSSLRNKELLRAIANQSLYTGYYKACKDYLQPVLQTLAISLPVMLALQNEQRTAVITAVIYSLLYVLTSYASRSSGRFAQRFPSLDKPLNRLLFLGIFCGLLSGLAYWAGMPLIAVILYICIYVIENLRKPMGIAYVTERMERDSLASSLSVESQAETLFAVIIALLIGFFSNLLNLGLGLLVVSVLALLASLAFRLPSLQKSSGAVTQDGLR